MWCVEIKLTHDVVEAYTTTCGRLAVEHVRHQRTARVFVFIVPQNGGQVPAGDGRVTGLTNSEHFSFFP